MTIGGEGGSMQQDETTVSEAEQTKVSEPHVSDPEPTPTISTQIPVTP